MVLARCHAALSPSSRVSLLLASDSDLLLNLREGFEPRSRLNLKRLRHNIPAIGKLWGPVGLLGCEHDNLHLESRDVLL